MCVLISSLSLSETFLIQRKPDRDMVKNVYLFVRQVLVILVRL